MSEKKIEGVPDGWRVVAIRKVKTGESFIGVLGKMEMWKGARNEESIYVYAVVERIEPEPPKPKYRPFANAAEFEPHRDRWVEYTSPRKGDTSFYRITCYDDERVWLGPDNGGKTFTEAMEVLKFDDGSPFGMEVTE